jgi:hypothetical protein
MALSSLRYSSITAVVFILQLSRLNLSGELSGHKFLITSVRTGDTEIFLVDPYMGDAVNLTLSP